MADLLIAALLAMLAVRWADGMKARERANEFARGVCVRANLSLLDDTVMLTASRWVRTASGGWQLHRTYTFDYSVDPRSRNSGFVILLGYRLASCGLAAEARECSRVAPSALEEPVDRG